MLKEALECATQSGYSRAEVAALASIGDLYADVEAMDTAETVYQQAQDIARRINDRFLLLYLDLAQATLTRLKGETIRARELLESAGLTARQNQSDVEQGLYQLEAGRLAFAAGNASHAVALLENAARRFDDAGGQRVEGSRAHLYLALAYHKVGDKEAVTDHLERAFQSASDLESHYPLVASARDAKDLLGAYRNHPKLSPAVSRLLRQVTEFEHNIPSLRRRLRRQASIIPFTSPSLEIQAFARAQVTLNGKVLTNSDWQTQSARDLFLCLLAHPDGLTKEELGNLVWPDSTSPQLKLKFKNTIYRLRQALVQEVILYYEDRYRFNRGLDYEYDVESFLGEIEKARTQPIPRRRQTPTGQP